MRKRKPQADVCSGLGRTIGAKTRKDHSQSDRNETYASEHWAPGDSLSRDSLSQEILGNSPA
jgi:hypothetical protein